MADQSMEEFLSILRTIPEKEFSGYTRFDRMTPEQRLDWLASAVLFAYAANPNHPMFTREGKEDAFREFL